MHLRGMRFECVTAVQTMQRGRGRCIAACQPSNALPHARVARLTEATSGQAGHSARLATQRQAGSCANTPLHLYNTALGHV